MNLTQTIQQLKAQGLDTLDKICEYFKQNEQNELFYFYRTTFIQKYSDDPIRIGLFVHPSKLHLATHNTEVTYLNFYPQNKAIELLTLQQQFFIVNQSDHVKRMPHMILFWLKHLDSFICDDEALLTELKTLQVSCKLISTQQNNWPKQLTYPDKRENLTHRWACFEILDCKHGRFCINRNDLYIGDALERYGEYSEPEVDLFKQLIHPGQTVIEVGANIGTHTIPLGKIVGVTGRVFAYEPQQHCFNLLTTNITLNSLTQVKPIYKALGSSKQELHLSAFSPYTTHNFGSYTLENNLYGNIPVQQTTLNDEEYPDCHFLKIDAEGMELQIIEGGLELIKRCRPIIYMEIDRKEQAERCLQLIKALNYRIQYHQPPFYNPNNFRNNSHNAYGLSKSHNALCIPIATI